MSSASNPLISVIIPSYNGCAYLSEALESALAQTYEPTEIIVVDDGSSDASYDVARRFGDAVSVTQIHHAGEGPARNRGIALAKGPFIAFLDQDDLWILNKLEQQMAAFVANPALDLVFGHVEHFVSPELDPATIPRVKHLMRVMPGLLPSALLARRSVFDRAGMFEHRWRLCSWVDWYMRATDLGLKAQVLPATLARRRVHRDNCLRVKSRQHGDYVRALKASLDRRRLVASN